MASRKVDLKVVMLGRQAVGKSALVDRFSNDRWTPGMATTIGGSFCAKELKIESSASAASASSSKAAPATNVTVGVWDTAGSERYESLTRHYFTQSEAAMCCFDLTDLPSWEKVAFWIEELQKVEPLCRIYIIGCKADLLAANQGTQAGKASRASAAAPKSRAVAKETVLKFCETVGPAPARYFETSALTGAGITQAFQQCAIDWLAKPKFERQGMAAAISLDSDEPKRRKKTLLQSCCNQ